MAAKFEVILRDSDDAPLEGITGTTTEAVRFIFDMKRDHNFSNSDLEAAVLRFTEIADNGIRYQEIPLHSTGGFIEVYAV